MRCAPGSPLSALHTLAEQALHARQAGPLWDAFYSRFATGPVRPRTLSEEALQTTIAELASAHREAIELAERADEEAAAAGAAAGSSAPSPTVGEFLWDWLASIYCSEASVAMTAYTLFETIESTASRLPLVG